MLSPLGRKDFFQHAALDRLDLHGRLVGLDFGQDFASLDALALALQPFRQFAELHFG